MKRKKFIIIIILMLFYLFCVDLFAQWEEQNSGVSVTLYDVCFVDSLFGWAIGDSSTILTTTDGGNSWHKQVDPDSLREMKKIQFINRTVGYIIGNDGLVLKSTNGGIKWYTIDSGFTYNYSDMFFIDESTGWITGSKEEPTTITGVILNTKTGGNKWSVQMEVQAESCGSISPLIFTSVAFLNDSTGWALGSDWLDNFSPTFVYFTSDSGNHWELIGSYESSPFANLEVITKDTLWAIGFAFGYSTTGGKSWIVPEYTDFVLYPIGISPINGRKGWAIHNNILSQEKEYKIMYTSDGGKSWQEELDLKATPGRAIVNISGIYVWIVGEKGLIMKKTNGVSSFSSQDNILQNYSLHQNYPNPFNPKTVISWQLAIGSHVELSIFDVLGQKVTTLVDEKQKAGTHKIEWDASKLSSGIYYYRLTTDNNFSQTRKMMVLK